MRNQTFRGASGFIQLQPNGEVQNVVLDVVSFNQSTLKIVGRYDTQNDDFELNVSQIYWGQRVTWIPSNRPYEVTAEATVSPFFVGTYLVLLIISFAVLAIVTGLLYKYRARNEIRLTSVNINFMFMLGCFIVWLHNAILLGILATDPRSQSSAARCNMTLWLLSLGFTICMSSLLVKTYRVNYLFNSKKLKKPPL